MENLHPFNKTPEKLEVSDTEDSLSEYMERLRAQAEAERNRNKLQEIIAKAVREKGAE